MMLPCFILALAAASSVAALESTVNCKMTVESYSNTTCPEFAKQWNIDASDFQAINPDVATCPTLGTGSYCIVGSVDGGSEVAPTQRTNTTALSFISGAPSSVANFTLPVITSTTPTGPYPTFSGMPSNCASYYKVAEGDTCAWVAQKHGISLAQLHEWNPSIENGIFSIPFPGPSKCYRRYH